MKIGKVTDHAGLAKEFYAVTGGFPAAVHILASLGMAGMSLEDTIQFVKERGLPEKIEDRPEWWQKNEERIRGLAQLKGAEFGG